VKNPVQALLALLGRGMYLVMMLAAVGSNKLAGTHPTVATWQLGELLVPSTLVLVPGKSGITFDWVKSPSRSRAVGTTPPLRN
jgi:hypothetical protein